MGVILQRIDFHRTLDVSICEAAVVNDSSAFSKLTEEFSWSLLLEEKSNSYSSFLRAAEADCFEQPKNLRILLPL